MVSLYTAKTINGGLIETGMVKEKGAALTWPSLLSVVTIIVGRGASSL